MVVMNWLSALKRVLLKNCALLMSNYANLQPANALFELDVSEEYSEAKNFSRPKFVRNLLLRGADSMLLTTDGRKKKGSRKI